MLNHLSYLQSEDKLKGLPRFFNIIKRLLLYIIKNIPAFLSGVLLTSGLQFESGGPARFILFVGSFLSLLFQGLFDEIFKKRTHFLE